MWGQRFKKTASIGSRTQDITTPGDVCQPGVTLGFEEEEEVVMQLREGVNMKKCVDKNYPVMGSHFGLCSDDQHSLKSGRGDGPDGKVEGA